MSTDSMTTQRDVGGEGVEDVTCQHQSTIDALRAALNHALIGKDDIIEMVLNQRMAEMCMRGVEVTKLSHLPKL